MIVVKCGGARVADAAAEVSTLAGREDEVVVVHGAGPQISAAMAELDLEVRFVRGRRVTSAAALAVVRRELAAANRLLCRELGDRAIGLMGDAIGLEARRIPELGLVGEPLPSRPAQLLEALELGLLPVVAPLAAGPLNVNADDAAAALAVGLGAERLVFVSDVPGLLHRGGVVGEIGADEADRLLRGGAFHGGIVPKLNAAARAARFGVSARIGETVVTG